MLKVPVVIVSAGNAAVSPANTVTNAPLVLVEAVEVNNVVLFVKPVVAPMLATLPARLLAPQALAKRKVAWTRVLV